MGMKIEVDYRERPSGIVGISQRKIQENISWLKEKGLIKRIGPDKGGYWEMVRK